MPPADYQTFVLLANPGTLPANVTITFLRERGAPVVRAFSVAAETRRNERPLSDLSADQLAHALLSIQARCPRA